MTKLATSIERLVDQNVRKWVLAEHAQERLKAGNVHENVGPYIVISRETGAGGSEIARLVGEKLGWDVLDKEILGYLAEKYGTPRHLLEFIDEKHVSWIQEFFETWMEGQGFTEATYMHRLHHLFFLAAHHGSVVIVGRGAQFVLPHNRGLSVRVIAPLDFRVEQVLLKKSLNAKEARKFVKESDRQREAFINEHFHHKVTDPHVHDLVINVEKLVQADAADVIVAAARSWMKKSGIGQSQDAGFDSPSPR